MLHHRSQLAQQAVGGPPPNENWIFGLLLNRNVDDSPPYDMRNRRGSGGIYPQSSTNGAGFSADHGWRRETDGDSARSLPSSFDNRFSQHAFDGVSNLLGGDPNWLRIDLPNPGQPHWIRFHLAAGRVENSGALRCWGHEIYGSETDATNRTNVKQKVAGYDWTTDFSVIDAEGTEYPSTTNNGQGRQDWVNASRDGGVGVTLYFNAGEDFVMRVYPDGVSSAFTAVTYVRLVELVP